MFIERVGRMVALKAYNNLENQEKYQQEHRPRSGTGIHRNHGQFSCNRVVLSTIAQQEQKRFRFHCLKLGQSAQINYLDSRVSTVQNQKAASD